MSNLADELEAKIVAAANQQARSEAELAFNHAANYIYAQIKKFNGWEDRRPMRLRDLLDALGKIRGEVQSIDAADRADKMRKQVADKAATVLTEMLK